MLRFRHAAAGIAVAAALVAGSADAGIQDDVYSVHDLVADAAGAAAGTDAALVNGWGLSAGPTTPWWVSNNATSTSTLYNGAGAKQALVVSVPGGPTGTVFNGNATDFVVSQGGKSGGARFLFATEGGQILGWSPTVNAATAIPGVDNAGAGAVYKGLAIAKGRLYATDFHNGRVDVYDAAWQKVPAPFADPKLPKGFAPFGIQALGDSIFVTYAKQDAAKHDDVAGAGAGYVDQFTTDGRLVARVASGGRKNAPPNAPWGLAMAPADFGPFGGDLLVGNFGDGRIHAFNPHNGRWRLVGPLRGRGALGLRLSGLWGLAFGNGGLAGPRTTLFFTSGPHRWRGATELDVHGLMGAVEPVR